MRLRDRVLGLAASVALGGGCLLCEATGAQRGGADLPRTAPRMASVAAMARQGDGNRPAAGSAMQLRVATYNIRSCEGLDGHYRCDRIAEILRRTGADAIALEEVRAEQAAEIARRLGFNVFFGHADTVHGHDFGNAILSRFAIRETHLYPIGVPGRQQRACLRADIAWPGGGEIVHVFAAHFGLSAAERREQAERLASPQILGDPAIQNEPRILLGDFNEKFGHGDVNRRLKPLLGLIGKRTWPAPLPFIDLDRIYFSGDWRRVSARVYRAHGAMIASDHLPLVAVLAREAGRRQPGDTAR